LSIVFPLPHGTGVGSGSWTVDQGVDIAAPGNTPLIAVGSGRIVKRGIGGFGGYAPVLKLDQPINGEQYVYYGHAGPGGPPVGAQVNAGDVVGAVGNFGGGIQGGLSNLSTGPHLEIGFSDANGTPVGPNGNASASLMRSLLGGATPAVGAGTGTAVSPGGSGILGSGIGPNIGPDLNPLDAITKALNNLFHSIVKHAKYAALTFVMIVGGFVLLGKGLNRATHAEAPA